MMKTDRVVNFEREPHKFGSAHFRSTSLLDILFLAEAPSRKMVHIYRSISKESRKICKRNLTLVDGENYLRIVHPTTDVPS